MKSILNPMKSDSLSVRQSSTGLYTISRTGSKFSYFAIAVPKAGNRQSEQPIVLESVQCSSTPVQICNKALAYLASKGHPAHDHTIWYAVQIPQGLTIRAKYDFGWAYTLYNGNQKLSTIRHNHGIWEVAATKKGSPFKFDNLYDAFQFAHGRGAQYAA